MPIGVSEYEHLAGEMLTLYEEAEQTMLKRMARRLACGVTTDGWTEKKYAEVSAVRKELADVVDGLATGRRTLAKSSLSGAYKGSAGAFETEASKFTDWAAEPPPLTCPSTMNVWTISPPKSTTSSPTSRS